MLSKLSKMYQHLSQPIEIRRFHEYQPEIKDRITDPSTINIALQWLSRARRNRTLFMQASSILEEKLKSECMYCGSLFTLQCELIENIEDVFLLFKKRQKKPQRNQLFSWDIND